jgi:4-carboxymuconolactone decarboxylase
MSDKPSLVQHLIGDIAPKLAEITDDVLFGDVWERPGLKKRDRSLVTVAALMAMNRLEQLPFHIGFALDNGVTRDEIVEEITQLAFYSGWPTAMSALAIAKTVFAEKA